MKKFLAFSFAILALFVASSAFCQSQLFTTQRPNRPGEGPQKGPPITASVNRDGQTVRVLVAANDVDGEPVPCTFYVNNQFFAEQADPPQGIFVGPDVATVPFNVKILCRDLYGNATIARLAITERSSQSTYTCTFKANGVEVSDDDISASQVGNGGVSLTFQGENKEVDGQEVQVSASVDTDGSGKAAGSVNYARNGVPLTVDLTGQATVKDDGQIDNFSVSDEDSGASLVCS